LSLCDRWSRDLVLRLASRAGGRMEIATSIGIVILVATAQVVLNVMAALAIGVVAAVALLLVKLSGSPVRRHLDARARSSLKVRGPEARELLRSMAAQIRILELEGELFFGTADRLQSEFEQIPEATRFVILDLRRVHQIDASGARVLEVIAQRAKMHGLRVVLSHVRAGERHGRYLRAHGLEAAIAPEHWFADLDRALEWAEDQLLQRARFEEAEGELPIERMSIFEGLSPEQVARATGRLERLELRGGDTVFNEGDRGDRMYFIARGAVSIKVRLDNEAHARRLATFTAGVMFGEMALLEGDQRSADAFAKGELVVLYSLSAPAFAALVHEGPALGVLIYRNLGRELAARLRATSGALRALE
jgi:SulP family sulfate permease